MHHALTRLTRLLAAALFTLPSPSAPAQTWEDLGPAPSSGFGFSAGRVSAIVCSPTDPLLWFAAGADGGVWRTQDGGASWQSLTDDQPTTAMGALAMDPADERVIYAGTGEANFANHSRPGLGILKSTDGGDTWRVLARETFAGRCFSKIVVDPTNPQRIFAAVTRAGGFPTRAAAKGHPGALGQTGVFRSMDGGESWTLLTGSLPAQDATDLAIDPGGAVYAAIGVIFGAPENGVYKSMDGGDSWQRLTSGWPTGTIGRVSIALAPSNPQRVYALVVNAADAFGNAGSTRGAWRSDNGGASWTALTIPSFQSTYGWYLSVVGVPPDNPDTAFFGGVSMVRTTNAGATFGGATPPHPDVHALAWDASGALVCGNDGGVHRSTSQGAAWTHHNHGLSTIQFYAGLSVHPTDDTVIFGGTQDNGTVRRSGETPVWTFVRGGDGGWTQVDPFSPTTVFAESQGAGALARSTDGGFVFTAVGGGITGRHCFLPPYVLDPATPGRVLYATERIWVSTNLGVSFTPLSADLTAGSPAAIRALAIAPGDPRYVYAATNDGRVLRSEDGGATFVILLTGNPGWPRVTRELFVDPLDARTVYLAGAAYGAPQVRRSRDAGLTWQTLDGDLPDVPVNVIAADTRARVPTIFAGAEDGVYVSVDDGASWRRYGAGLSRAPVVDLILEPRRARLIAATQGRGAWRAEYRAYCTADFDGDGDVGTDADIEAFFACLAGNCCAACASIDVNADGDSGTDADIEAFFRVLSGGPC